MLHYNNAWAFTCMHVPPCCLEDSRSIQADVGHSDVPTPLVASWMCQVTYLHACSQSRRPSHASVGQLLIEMRLWTSSQLVCCCGSPCQYIVHTKLYCALCKCQPNHVRCLQSMKDSFSQINYQLNLWKLWCELLGWHDLPLPSLHEIGRISTTHIGASSSAWDPFSAIGLLYSFFPFPNSKWTTFSHWANLLVTCPLDWCLLISSLCVAFCYNRGYHCCPM